MSLIVYKSNRLEVLVEALSGVWLERPLSTPLVCEQVVVETQGMAQWLKLELARRQGVVANVAFPFPRAFISGLIRAVVPVALQAGSIEPEALAWRIFGKLPELAGLPAFAEIRGYLSGTDDPRRGFQLAERAASLLDQYSVYRPGLIEEWKRGGGADWQGALWRAVMTDGVACQGRFLFEVMQALRRKELDLSALPERVSIFGPGSLPPMYLKVFEALGERIPVHLFYFCPCREYFGDDPSALEADRIQQRVGGGALGAEDLHLGGGNPLLASCGRTGQGFQKLMTELGAEETERFEDPGDGSLLARVQSSILNLEECRPGEKIEVNRTDRSIQVHSCHSPLRELQVLRDHMLDWFASDTALTPQDILVMLTDVEAYAPFIKGVFGDAEPGAPGIPIGLADRGARLESPLVDGFARFLKLAGSRLGATAVVEFLETGAVRRRFGVGEDDLEQVRDWIQAAAIRWGRSGEHRADFGVPGFPEHTWEHGCGRLLLGYAMADTKETVVHELLPCEGIEGTSTDLLGRWLDFLEALFAGLEKLARPRTLEGWADLLNELLDAMFLPDATEERAANAIRQELDKLRQQQRASGFEEEIPLRIVLERILPKLEEPQPGKAFLRGGVMFCGLSPMRGIPFKVVCLLGMQDGAFPRNPAPLSFDLMAASPQAGDESRRDDDRYLFLESLLAARERLYISYIGQSVRDNSARPPSVVVSELLDYIGARYRVEGAGADTPGKEPVILTDLVLTTHRLHAFSPAYFAQGEGVDARLFSYSPAAARVSQALENAGKREVAGPFVESPLSDVERPEAIPLQELKWFFKNPCRVFVERSLQFRLPEDGDQLLDEEPFTLDGLSAYRCKQEALEGLVLKREPEGLMATWKGSGQLPPGPVGKCIASDIIQAAGPLVERVRSRIGEGSMEDLAFECSVGGHIVQAQLKHVPGVGLVHCRAAKVERKKAEPHIRLWIEHLVYQLSDAGAGKPSWLIGEDEVWKFNPVSNAEEILKRLVEYYERGLAKPLPFFPNSAFRYVIEPKQKAKKSAKERALEMWEGEEDSDYNRGEKRDPYFDLCFRNHADPLGEDFQAIARDIVNPLLAHEVKEVA